MGTVVMLARTQRSMSELDGVAPQKITKRTFSVTLTETSLLTCSPIKIGTSLIITYVVYKIPNRLDIYKPMKSSVPSNSTSSM